MPLQRLAQPEVTVELTRRLHAVESPLRTWLSDLAEGLAALVPGATLPTAFLVAEHEEQVAFEELVLPKELEHLAAEAEFHAPVMLGTYAARTGAFTQRELERAGPPPGTRGFREKYEAVAGPGEGLAFCARVGSHRLFASVSTPGPLELARGPRRTLHRLALHAEAALELRLRPGKVRLVLDSRGRVLERNGGEHLPVADLRAHVRQVEGAVGRKGAHGADGIALWTALSRGRYGLVERSESDGQRHWVLVERQSAGPLVLGLSEVERDVAERAAAGASNKMIAYALGLSEGAVSHALGRAATKLGFRGRAELVRAVAILLGGGQSKAIDASSLALTGTEQTVLALVQDGRPNAEIARIRGVSERTIANQVAAILRKTGSSSRRTLSTTFRDE